MIDVSGDGPNNMGYPVLAGARDGARPRHHHQRPADHDPRRLFRRLFNPEPRRLLRGLRHRRAGRLPRDGEEHRRFAEAIRRKLVLEIAGRRAEDHPGGNSPSRNGASTARSARSSEGAGWIPEAEPGEATRPPDCRRASTRESRQVLQRSGSRRCRPSFSSSGSGFAFPLSGDMRSATSSPILAAPPGTVAAGMRGGGAAVGSGADSAGSAFARSAIRCRSRVASATTATDWSGDAVATCFGRFGSGTTLPPV